LRFFPQHRVILALGQGQRHKMHMAAGWAGIHGEVARAIDAAAKVLQFSACLHGLSHLDS